jgi:hypothetical protein
LDQAGLLNDILIGANHITEGRKGFAIPGKERFDRVIKTGLVQKE